VAGQEGVETVSQVSRVRALGVIVYRVLSLALASGGAHFWFKALLQGVCGTIACD